MLRLILSVAIICLLCSATPHHTTAYIGSKGDWEILPSYSYYSTKTFWNCKGHKLPAYDKFHQETGNLYLEYAVDNKNSIFFEGAYNKVSESLNHNCKNFEDPRVGWKHQFYLREESALTGQITLTAPYGKHKTSVRYGQFGIEASLIYSDLFDFWDSRGWYDLSAGYLCMTGFPSDQIKAKAALGYLLFSHCVILAEVGVDYGLDLGKLNYKSNFITLNSGYRLVRGQLEFRWELLERAWLILGTFQHLAGKNNGCGGGGFGGAWITF